MQEQLKNTSQSSGLGDGDRSEPTTPTPRHGGLSRTASDERSFFSTKSSFTESRTSWLKRSLSIHHSSKKFSFNSFVSRRRPSREGSVDRVKTNRRPSREGSVDRVKRCPSREGSADRVKTNRPMPKHVIDDGVVVPSFAYDKLADVSSKPIGHGNQALVYSCRVPFGRHGGERMALKVLRPELAASQFEVHAFVREANFLARLSHANVVSTLGCGTTSEGLPCLLVDWVESDASRAMRLDVVDFDAGARRAARRAWPSGRRVALIRDLAAALAFLHGGEAIPGGTIVLHRDVKPDNMGLTGRGQLKLLDFGLAVALQKTAATTREAYELTGGAGTRRYMAPECAAAVFPYGVAADTYSLGIVAREIFALRGKPFAGFDVDDHTRRVVHGGERPSLPPGWDPRIAALLPRAWAARPADRCDAADVAAGLAAVLAAPATTDAGAVVDPLPDDEATGACCVVS